MPFEQSSNRPSSDSLMLLKMRLAKFETKEGRLAGLAYRPKSADEVIISTTPKAGTTWVQQICHQIRSGIDGGDMSFDEISQVVPWLELAHDQGQDLYDTQYRESDGMPRLFKTHAWEQHCPLGCKVIVVLRDPMDVLISFYSFFKDWFFEGESISMEDFADEFWLARGVPTSRMNNASYFVHLVSWFKRRHDSNVLVLIYEDLKDNLEKQVLRIAKFMSTQKHNFAKAEIVRGATYRSSFEFMLAHKSKFDEKLSKLARNEACGLSKAAGSSKGKLNRGQSGFGKQELSVELQSKIQAKWRDVVLPETGCSTYEELRTSLLGEEHD